MNQLQIGRDRDFKPPLGSYFWIDSKVPKVRGTAHIFEPNEHSLDVLKDMNYQKAAALTAGILALFPGGENTLTKEDAAHELLSAFMGNPTTLFGLIPPSKDVGREKARRMIERILLSPVLHRVLCGGGKTFTFKTTWRSVTVARINPAELGAFDARALVHFLLALYPGQFLIPSFGRYALDSHMDLIEQDRLIAGVNSLSELPDDLRDRFLIEEKVPQGASYDDAVRWRKARASRRRRTSSMIL
jgi:hypothetical protein